ncbi:MAG: hypothetical protein R2737_07105 [Candidatus Nanopelagicales bacterium]
MRGSFLRWVLVAEALLVVHPVFALSSLVGAPQTVAKGLVQVQAADVVAAGVAVLLAPLVVLALLEAGVAARGRPRYGWALILQVPVAAFAVVPMLAPMATLSRWPRVSTIALLTLALVVVLSPLVPSGARYEVAPGARTRARRLAVSPLALGLLVALVSGTVGAFSTSLPTDLGALAPAGFDSGRRGVAAETTPAAQNPALAPDPFGLLHNDSWATDAYVVPGPSEPMTAEVSSLFTGGDCATITFDSAGRLITLCSSLTRVTAWAVDPVTMTPLASTVVGRRTPSLTDFSGGGYFVLDAEDRVVMPAQDGWLRSWTLSPSGDAFVEGVSVDVSGSLADGESVTSVVPDWSGRWWYVGSRGTVGVVSPGAGGAAPQAISLNGESIENSFAVAQDAVYVVTGAAMYRLWAGPDKAPRVVWRQAYDTGTQRKPGQTSRASGTTPTVFDGGRLVAITDNAEPRMNVVVMRTAVAGDGQRVVCTVPVFAPGASATENSLVAVGRSLYVENNYGYAPPLTVVAAGGSTSPGLARVDVGASGCAVAWTNETIRIPSLVSKGVAPDGVVLTYTKPTSAWGVDAWYVTAVDLESGEELWSRRAGAGMAANNHYAGVALGPDGSAYVGVVMGLIKLATT